MALVSSKTNLFLNVLKNQVILDIWMQTKSPNDFVAQKFVIVNKFLVLEVFHSLKAVVSVKHFDMKTFGVILLD